MPKDGESGPPMSGLGAALGAMDEIFNPAAARAREELEHQNHQVVATPSPGDLLLKTGTVVIAAPAAPTPEATGGESTPRSAV
jgi:hypothetical protein